MGYGFLVLEAKVRRVRNDGFLTNVSDLLLWYLNYEMTESNVIVTYLGLASMVKTHSADVDAKVSKTVTGNLNKFSFRTISP